MTKATVVLDPWPEDLYLISDIHANAPALRSVLSAIPDDAVILCAGDIVDYYKDPNEVCDLLRERGVLCIQGNHDEYVLSGVDLPPDRDRKYMTSWTRTELTEENRAWLASLPTSLDVLAGGRYESPVSPVVRVFHGSMTSNEDRLYPDTDLSPFEDATCRLLVGGHTHHPMVRESGNNVFINPGSVGQPRDWKPGAAFAILHSPDATVTFERASYDIAGYVSDLVAAGFPEDTARVLLRQREVTG